MSYDRRAASRTQVTLTEFHQKTKGTLDKMVRALPSSVGEAIRNSQTQADLIVRSKLYAPSDYRIVAAYETLIGKFKQLEDAVQDVGEAVKVIEGI